MTLSSSNHHDKEQVSNIDDDDKEKEDLRVTERVKRNEENKQSSSTRLSLSLSSSPPASQQDKQQITQPEPVTYIGRLIVQMKECLKKLNATNITFPKCESMAILIHESMSRVSRNYHSIQHVFDLTEGLKARQLIDGDGISEDYDPIAILSAFFHDCIYYHVDGGLSGVQAKLLRGTYDSPSGETFEDATTATTLSSLHFRASTNNAGDDNKDRLLAMVEMIFGYQPGQAIDTRNGLNEFLSAVVAVRQLQDHLTMEELARIACCIESTIPFRNNKTDTNPLETLYQNMQKTRDAFELNLTNDDLIKSVQRAAILANEDVGNFGSSDRGFFLDNTWMLLPETNEGLRSQYLYTIHQFQKGLKNMYSFLSSLQPSSVFSYFRGVPSMEDIASKTQQCEQNIQFARIYLGAKLLSISVLAALAELTGGDAPMSLFVGDLPNRPHFEPPSGPHPSVCNRYYINNYGATLEGWFQQQQKLQHKQVQHEGEDDCDMNIEVFHTLSIGRRTETNFDIRQSPLGAFIYGNIGTRKLQSLLNSIPLYPLERDNSLQLLESLPRPVILSIAKNVSKIAISRAELIQNVVDNLSPQTEDDVAHDAAKPNDSDDERLCLQDE